MYLKNNTLPPAALTRLSGGVLKLVAQQKRPQASLFSFYVLLCSKKLGAIPNSNLSWP